MKTKTDRESVLEKEVEAIMDWFFSVYVGAKYRTTRDIAKKLLMKNCILRDGKVMDVHAKHRGLGVYDVWLEERP